MKHFSILLSILAAGLLMLTMARAATAQHGTVPSTEAHAAATHAAEDEGHGAGSHADGSEHKSSPIPPALQGIAPAITTLISFAIVFFVLYAKVWPKITEALDERARKIREEIAAAEAARKQAKDALDEYERSLAQARAEAQKMLEETRSQQAELAAQLRAKADSELTQMRERAKRDIESAKRSALNEIYSESVAIATLMASKILQREISTDDQAKLVEESLAELASKNN